MEAIHLYLGELESTMYEDKATSQQVRMIFGLIETKHERKYVFLCTCAILAARRQQHLALLLPFHFDSEHIMTCFRYCGGSSHGVSLKFSIVPQPENFQTLTQLAAMLHFHYEMK